MAEKQAGGLSLRIGLTLSQLQSDFLAAEQTVKQGIAALNRQQNIVRLKMETDVTGLDSVADKTKILEVQERGLNQLLEMQRDRLTLATKAYQDYANSKNANATTTKNLEAAMERERLAVARLESQLKSLSAQRISIDTTQLQDNIAKLNAKIQHVKITAEIDTSKLKNSAFVFEQQKVHVAALTKELELQRQKLAELQNAMNQAAKVHGADSVQSLNIKSNVLQQIQEINRLETRLKELKNTRIDLQFRTDSIRRVEAEVSENISRINAKIEHIKVKTDIDVSKLGSAASEFDRAKAHVQGLNRELDLQNQKLAEMRRTLATSISLNGLNNVKTINLQTDIQRQIQEIDRLKAKIKELNNIPPPKSNNLLSGYLNIKGDVVGKLNEISSAFSQLKGATASADSAITASLGVIGTIPHPVGRAVAAFAALPIVLRGVENSLIDMTRAAAASGDAVYVMSRGFQMSIKDTGKFTSMCKTAGVEVSDLSSTIRRVQQAIVRGGDDAKAEQVLKRYGESAFDASGRLKDLNEMTLTLSRALKRAQAEGNGMAFILATMRNASADAITAIEDAEGVYQQAAGLVKNGLADPTFAHEVQGNINALNLQASFMKASFESALLPVANEIIPRVTERMGKMTRVISDNKDVIKQFGRDAAEVFLSIEHAAEIVIGAFGSVMKGFYDLKKRPEQDELVARFKTDLDIKSIDDLIKKAQPKAYDFIKNDPRFYAQVKAQYQPIYQAIADAQAEIKRKQEELAKTLATPVSVANFSSIGQERAKLELDEGSLDSLRQARKYQEEAEAILYKIGHSDYDNQKLDLEQWRTNLLREAELSAQEREAIEQLYAAKSAQIEQERADKLQEIRDQINSADKTALENKLADIEKERRAWLKAGMDEAEATELAEQQKANYIKGIEKELSASLQSIYQTELENRLSQIEQEKQAWIDKCNDEVAATQWAEQAKMDAQRDAAMSVIKQQAKEYEAYQQGGFEGLQAYKVAQLQKSGVDTDYLYMTPEQLQQFQKANQVADKSLMPNFMTDTDRANYQAQRAADQQRAQEFDKQNYAIVNGVKMGLSEAIGGQPIKISLDKDSELEMVTGTNRATVRDYETDNYGRITQMTERDIELPSIVEGVTQRFSELKPPIQSATESLGELPTAVQGVMEQLQSIEPQQYQAADQSFSEIPSAIQSATESLTESLSQLPTTISTLTENLSAGLSPMSQALSDVTIKINDFATSLDALFKNLQTGGVQSGEKQPVEVSTTVQIEEAHAWDYSHIQELAEKVANVIKPEILSAIGGGDNAY